MENLKIKVNSEAESKEVQELFFGLGAKWKSQLNRGEKALVINVAYPSIFLYGESMVLNWRTIEQFNEDAEFKEITIPELRDMVVLKRNDVGDATHENNHGQKLYKAQKGWCIYGSGSWLWNEESLGYTPIPLKPIEKPMKEPKQAKFLVKTDGGYVLQVLDENAGGENVVRVPDGAEWAKLWDDGEIYQCIEFYKEKNEFFSNTKKVWMRGHDQRTNKLGQPARIIWQRETLNDQVASAEEYREMISNAAGVGLTSVVTDIAQSCSGVGVDVSLQGKSEFPLNNYELNHRVAKAFNAVRGTDLNEDDVNYLRELIDLTISHYGERK